MLTLNDGRAELWQWDTGRTLAVDADCSQVHFSNKVFGRSIDVDVVAGAAVIPDILLQTDKDLNVWAFVGTPENGYTKISKTFKVNRRNKPADYVFTPSEQTTIAELLERIHDDLQEATNEALAQAKASGEFDGADGAPGIYYGTTQPTGDTHPVWIDPGGDPDDGGLLPAVTADDNGKVLRVVSGEWAAADMPEVLPNHNALTFTGAVTGSYDGSAPLSVEIPSAVTDDHINSLIDTKLGVIENGSY